jgi:putative transcriptional regulator
MALKKTTKAVRKRSEVGDRRLKARAAPAKVDRRPRKGSQILADMHETAVGLHKIGLMDTQTMREFDKLCLEPVLPFRPSEIAALRKREKVSQPVFAIYLNVSKSSVSQWETGEKKPDGAALKLLNLVQRKGLEALA